MARLRTFTRTDGSTIRLPPAEYERRKKLQAAALRRAGYVVLEDSRGRQRGYAPHQVEAERRRRERTAEAARKREARKRAAAPAGAAPWRYVPPPPPPGWPRSPTWREVESTTMDLGEPSDASLAVAWTYDAAERNGPGRLRVEVATTILTVEVPSHTAREWRSDLVAALLDLLAGADPAALAVRAEVLRRERADDEDDEEEEEPEPDPPEMPATGGRGDTPNQPRPAHSYPTRIVDGELVLPPGFTRVLRLSLGYEVRR